MALRSDKQPNGSLKRPLKKNKGFVSRLVSIALRLSVWYTLLTVLFRCPSSPKLLTPDSPNVCEPYFQLRDVALPHLQPYYNTYAAPYVHQAQPYFDRVKEQAYAPAVAFARKHGAPRLAHAQTYANKEWKRSVRPQLDVAHQHALKQYHATLGPHVQKVQDAVSPYYNTVKASASDFYELELQPAYKHTAPYAKKFYAHAYHFSVNTALPYARWGTDLTFTFVRRQIWPRIQVLYGENVEPQIFKISQRLGRYRDEKKIESAVESAASASSSSTSLASSTTPASSTSAVASSASPVVGSVLTKASSAVMATPSMAASEEEPSAAEKFTQDLKVWEEHVAIAVHEGVDHLRERIQEICDRQIETQANGVGEALIVRLEESSSAAFRSLKAKVETVIAKLPEDASDSDVSSAQESISNEVKKAGQTIKQKAQNVREWKQTFDQDTTGLVEAAANSTLETIDNIRDLRLQEIGRRWASNAAITHKDWSKYNDLKKASNKGRDEVAALAVSNDRLIQAQKKASDIEERALGIAEDAAKELARLKQVSQWKLDARDDSDDFNTKYAPAAAVRAKQQVVDKVSNAVGSSQGSVESATSVVSEAVLGSETGSIESASSKISQAIIGSEQPTAESIASVFSQSAKSAATAVSSSIIGTEPGVVEQVSEAVVGRETPVLESVSSAASSLVADQSLDPEKAKSYRAAAESQAAKISSSAADYAASPQSIMSEGSSSLTSAASKASSSASSAASQVSSSASSAASDVSSSASSAASQVSSSASSVFSQVADDIPTTSVKKVWGGAMAQAVPVNSVVLDEDIVDDDYSYSSKLQDIVGSAGDQASQLTQAVQEALMKPSPTQGNVESVTSLASEQYEKALSAASSVLFGTQQGTGESMTSALSAKYTDAVSAASNAIYGSSSSNSFVAQASSRYDEAVDAASQQYDMAKSRVSVQISGTPQPVHEQMLASVQSVYSAVPSMTGFPQYFESVSSIASSRLSEARSLASAQLQSAKVQAGVMPTPAQSKILAEAQRRYYEGIGLAYDRYEAFEAAAKDLVRPTSTPTYSDVLAAAQSQYSSAVGAASSNMDNLLSSARSVVSGTTQSPAQSLVDQASIQYNAAVSTASSYLVKASEAVYGTQTAAYENLLAAAQSQYDSAYAAASSNLHNILDSASASAAPAFDTAFDQYESAVSAAAASYSELSVKASEAIYGTSTNSVQSAASMASTALFGSETPWTEAAASQASENWEALVSKASEQVYGAPTPFADSFASQAGEYAAQATDAAIDQYAAVTALFSELVNGREPEFTESVWGRLQSAYSTGAPALASSASSFYASASSAVSDAFTPPPALESIINNAQQEIDSAVNAVSIQVYGTSKGSVEQMTEAAGSAYNDVASKASEAIYNSGPTGYAEAAQSQISDAANSAQEAISEALFGTPTNTVESMTSGAASVYTSISSVASENLDAAVSRAVEQYEAVTSSASVAIYGSEQGAFESAQSRISVAMESARSRMAEMGDSASKATVDSVSMIQEAAQDAASSASSVAESVSSRVRDEL